METIIQSLQDPAQNLHGPALNSLLALAQKTDITTLKLLNDHRTTLTNLYHTLTPDLKPTMADILSLIYILTDPHASLSYRLLGNTLPARTFGHQYVKKILATLCTSPVPPTKSLFDFLVDGLSFLFESNCECDGVDLLVELGMERFLSYFVDKHNFERVGVYLGEMCFYEKVTHVIVDCYMREGEWERLLVALMRNGIEENCNNDEKDSTSYQKEISNEVSIENNIDDSENENLNNLKRKKSKNAFYENSLIFNKMLKDVPFSFDGSCGKLNYKNLSEGKIFFYRAQKSFKENVFYILSVCEWNDFLQILFYLSRINFYVTEEEIENILNHREEILKEKNSNKMSDENLCSTNNKTLSLEDKIELAKKIINNRFLPQINAILHKDLQIIAPYPIEKFIKGIPKLDSEVTLRFFSPLCIANALTHYGFGYDSLIFAQDSEYNVDLLSITENDKLELISIISSIGLIKKNRAIYGITDENNNDGSNLIRNSINSESMQSKNDNSSANKINSSKTQDSKASSEKVREDEEEYNMHYKLFDDLIEEYAFTDESSYKKSGALLCLALQQNTYDSDHTYFAFLAENLNSTCRYMKISSLLGIQYLYCGSRSEMVRNALIPLMYSENVETCAMACFTLGSVFYGTADEDLLNYFMTVFIEKRNDQDNAFFNLIGLSIGLLFMNQIENMKESHLEFCVENGIDGIVKGLCYVGSGRTDIIEELVDGYIEVDDSDTGANDNKDDKMSNAKKSTNNSDNNKVNTSDNNKVNTSDNNKINTSDSNKVNTSDNNKVNNSDNNYNNDASGKSSTTADDSNKTNLNSRSGESFENCSDKKVPEDENNNDEQNVLQNNVNNNLNNTNNNTNHNNNINNNDGSKKKIDNFINDALDFIEKRDKKESLKIYNDFDPITIKTVKSFNLLGITLISLNDTHTRSICKKLLVNQLLKDKNNTIPMCLSILYTSEPDVEIIDALSRSINGQSPITSILGLGLVGAGTNNTRIQQTLEQQYQYLTKNTRASGALKVAQGLVGLGKGTLSLSPLIFDKTVINKKSLIGLLGIAVLGDNDSHPLFLKHSYLLHLLSQSISNKFVVTLDEKLIEQRVTVRVGRPVQTVGMAGKPKGISAVVTHDSPVIVQGDEKGAIYEEEGFTYKGFVEDVVIVSPRE
ncbi:proteasome regulatory particle base subunit [Conglomerata obtusa]